jgi:HAD superfamily hydrolase (TIGR01490 family)
MKKIVFFDLDGTILSGISSENAFFLHLLKHGYLGIKQFLSAFLFILKWLPKYKLKVFIKNKAYLTGLKVDQISALGKKFVIQKLQDKIRPALEKRILMHQKAGDLIVLLTGTHEFLANIFAQYLNIDQVEATKCTCCHNRFTNLPPEKHPFSTEKLRIAEKLCQTNHILLKNCCAYGNSINDAALLKQVGQPIAVHPDWRLQKIAKKQGWEILETKD